MFCDGYRTELKPQDCIDNQLSIFCLPDFPCYSCNQAVVLAIAEKKKEKVSIPKGMTKAVAKSMGYI